MAAHFSIGILAHFSISIYTFEDNDGLIAGEHAFRITPEDEECEGAQIDRSVVRCDESYSTADGKMLHYVARCLKPKTGKTVKPYTKGGE